MNGRASEDSGKATPRIELPPERRLGRGVRRAHGLLGSLTPRRRESLDEVVLHPSRDCEHLGRFGVVELKLAL